MFDNQNTPPTASTPSSSDMSNIPVYTMPDKFMSPQANIPAGSSSGGGGKKIILIVVAIVVLALLGIGVYAFMNFDKLFGKKNLANTNAINNSVINNNINNQINNNVNINSNLNSDNNLNANINTNINSITNSFVGFGNQNTNNSLNNNLNQNSNNNSNINDNLNNSNSANVNASSPLLPSQDTDADGLTNDEELAFLTDKIVTDTDGDGFSDGAEVASGFDPAKTGGAKLDASVNMNLYANTKIGYTLRYPASFAARENGEDGKEYIITTPTGEFIQVSIQDNLNNLPVLDWYLTQSSTIDRTKVSTIVVNGKSAVLSPDHLNVYIGDNNRIIVLTYNPGTKTEISYNATFQYIYQHLIITPTPNPLSSNSNLNQ